MKRKATIKNIKFKHDKEDLMTALGIKEEVFDEVLGSVQLMLFEQLKEQDHRISITIENILKNYNKNEMAVITSCVLHELATVKEELMMKILMEKTQGVTDGCGGNCSCGNGNHEAHDPEEQPYEAPPEQKDDPMYG